MSKTLCQSVQQQQFEPRPVEPWQIQLLFPPRPVSNDPEQCTKTTGLRGWSFLQSLSIPTQNDNQKIYEHPFEKTSKSTLSEKSLEMCTESLGSETGSIISESEDDTNNTMSYISTFKSKRNICNSYSSTKRVRSNIDDFPPPLSTIIRNGTSCGVQVKSLREDGRLVLKAVCVATPQTCFDVERRDGTLKLRFLDQLDDQFQRGEDDDDDDDDDDE